MKTLINFEADTKGTRIAYAQTLLRHGHLRQELYNRIIKKLNEGKTIIYYFKNETVIKFLVKQTARIFIPNDERVLAAKYFAVCDIGEHKSIAANNNSIDLAYGKLEKGCLMPGGNKISYQYAFWLKAIDGGDVDTYNLWMEVRGQFAETKDIDRGVWVKN